MGLFNLRKKQTFEEFLSGLFSNSSPLGILRDVDATASYCEDLIASSIAGMSFDVYDMQDRTKQKRHPLYKALNNPNPEEPRFTFFYNLIKDYFKGNIFIYHKILDTGDLFLYRLPSEKVDISRDALNQKQYNFNGKMYTNQEILHIPSRYGYDGTKGQSVRKVFNEIFNINGKLYDFVSNVLDNAIASKLIVDISKAYPNATPEQLEAIRNKFLSQYTGAANAGKPIIKTGPIEYSELKNDQIDNKALQLIENRQYQEREISKIYGVPYELITGEAKDLESVYTLFVDSAVKPIVETLQDYLAMLFIDTDRIFKYIEFDYNSLIKTSLQTKIESYGKQLSSGILNINEVRRKENLPPIDGGDTNIIYGGNFLPIRQDILDAYMASAKEKAKKVDSVGIGDQQK